MNIAVIDDCAADAEAIVKFIGQFAAGMGTDLKTSVFSSGESFLARDILPFSIVIMDIDMPGRNGIECAREMRRRSRDAVLMFITNMPQYALAGYEVDAVDYIIKPVGYADFSLKLRKALRYAGRSSSDIVLHTGTELIRVPVWEILYIETQQHYLIYHTADRDIRVRETMAQAEEKLSSASFAKCNSCYLVNLRCVTGIKKEEVLIGSAGLKMSRGCRNEFVNRFAAYVGGLEG